MYWVHENNPAHCIGAGRNWARRNTCNVCNTAKPGTVDVNREGHGGGFKELDEEEVAEARRRREEFENDDTEMFAPGPNLLFDLLSHHPG